MPLLVLLLALQASPAEDPNDVLFVSYQGAGRSPELAQRLLASMSQRLPARGFTPRAPSESEKQERAAAMCGEDAECLATLGRRLDADWVVGLGLGAIGKQTLINVLLVNVETGRVEQRFSRQLATAALDANTVGADAIQALFAGLAPRVKLTPPPAPVEVTPVEPPPAVVTPVVNAQPAAPRPVRSAAIGTTVAAGVLAAAGIGLSVGAAAHYGTLAGTAPQQRPDADALQRGLNVGADVSVGLATAAAVTAIILFIVDGGAAK